MSRLGLKEVQKLGLAFYTHTVIINAVPREHAGMAELADALVSGISERILMQVQVLFPAPKQTTVEQSVVVLFCPRSRFTGCHMSPQPIHKPGRSRPRDKQKNSGCTVGLLSANLPLAYAKHPLTKVYATL